MNLPLKFAVRYLFARKSYNVINLISGIGVAGMAVGTAALIIILSVFNGFNRIVSESLADARPDIQILPSQGKVFVPDSAVFEGVIADDRVLRLSSVLEDQVFVSYEGRQTLARAKGVDEASEEESPLRSHVVSGEWQLHRGSVPLAIAGAGLAGSLGANPRFVTPLEIYYPSRTKSISPSNPTASLRSVKVRLSGLFSVSSDIDSRLILVPIELMRDLLEYGDEVSSLEIWAADGATESLQKDLQDALGPSFKVLDRTQQDASLYRMIRFEKLAIYLILIFVVVLIAFNILSSLRMLVIEKQEDCGTLRAIGAPEGMIRKIFLLEGWLVSLLGMVIGLVVATAVVLLQQKFGIVRMPGNFIVEAYPVVMKLSDVLWTVAGVASIGLLMALIPSRRV